MSLTLHLHPLSSYCHKVLIALYESEVDFHPRIVDFGNPESAAELRSKWPLGKIPILEDTSRNKVIPETSIMIEYLQQHYPGKIPLLPADPELNLEARLWDRFFDLHVSTPMQKFVADWMRPVAQKDPLSIEGARQALDIAYAILEKRLVTGPWIAGDIFTIAECAAAPALFYSAIVHPIDDGHTNLRSYFERLLKRPSVRRTLLEAQPYFSMYPFVADMPQRFKEKNIS